MKKLNKMQRLIQAIQSDAHTAQELVQLININRSNIHKYIARVEKTHGYKVTRTNKTCTITKKPLTRAFCIEGGSHNE